MKKQSKKKLAINKETIKALDRAALTEVAGGAYTCAGSMCGSCSYKSAVAKCVVMEM